jgi:hypothetical protein
MTTEQATNIRITLETLRHQIERAFEKADIEIRKIVISND